MIFDARQLADDDERQTDVLIIGTGAAGLALAAALDKSGVETILLEAGGERLDKVAQDLYRAAVIEPADHGPVHMYRRRAFGGTTAIWGGRCIPFDPIDIEARPWIPHADWPIGYDAVSPYYKGAMEVCEAGAPVFDAEAAFGGGRGPMVEGFVDEDVITDRIERFSEPTHFGRRYRQMLERSARVSAYLHANVMEIVTNESGASVTGVVARTADGKTLRVKAKRVVVAAGGLETPRLLLASRGVRANGLGNERDLVGRFYQSHLEGDVGEIRFEGASSDARMDYQKTTDGVYARRYIWLSPAAQRREKLAGLILRPHHVSIVDPAHGNPVLSAMYLVKDTIVPEYSRRLTSTEQSVREQYAGRTASFYGAHVANIVKGAPTLAPFAVNWMLKRNLAKRKLPSVVLRDRRNRYSLDLNAEQCPNPDSRIRLSSELDALGMPRLQIDWRTTDQDRDMIVRGLKVVRDGMTRGGGGDMRLPADEELVERAADCTRVGGHHIGSVRMGRTPETGVVDGDGQVFGVSGLYVSGAATFPTSSFANPTLLIVALALRLADHLTASRGR